MADLVVVSFAWQPGEAWLQQFRLGYKVIVVFAGFWQFTFSDASGATRFWSSFIRQILQILFVGWFEVFLTFQLLFQSFQCWKNVGRNSKMDDRTCPCVWSEWQRHNSFTRAQSILYHAEGTISELNLPQIFIFFTIFNESCSFSVQG